MKDRSVDEVVRGKRGNSVLSNLVRDESTGLSSRKEYAYSMEVITFLLRNITRFCTSVFRVSGARIEKLSSNKDEMWEGNSAVSLG
jgi:hypothetical protein